MTQHPTATGSIFISASPESVFELISDPRTLVKYAEETFWVLHRRESLGKTGSLWLGLNRNKWHVWPTLTKIVDAEPGRRFAFEVSELGVPVSKWQYDIEPGEHGGATVTESTWDRRPKWFEVVTYPFTGVQDRVTRNTENIAKSLGRLKFLAEGTSD